MASTVGDSARCGEAVGRAAAEGWLVQAYVLGPRLATGSTGTAPRHDLALGVVGGRLAGAFARTGHEQRPNASLSGRLHPLYG
ncbi:hypothetical protein [Streptomyces purpurogeneiscleroticus]|uniref:hypothetical protein n=1 Tax=Streptomyces purpurogeneiscleroticus TaxID=68259 RepID=UPI001CBBBEA4|nr:hypothetical protein [Streptomyces purpurogeneiscleroticus]MBZ4016240.1 hypothetical protein [Streptomyces purpurogeneiscleroticus]